MFIGCDNGSPTGTGVISTELEGTWAGHAAWSTTAYSITFTQNSFSMKSGSGAGMTEVYAGTFSTNPNVNPKQMDAYITQSAISAQYVGKTSLCIYKISNDSLFYAGNEPGNIQRPASFAPDTSGTTAVFFLKRQ
jgi:uncharacterized protein (TIGR03067 family)